MAARYVVYLPDGTMLAGDGINTDYYSVREFPDAFKYPSRAAAVRHAERSHLGFASYEIEEVQCAK